MSEIYNLNELIFDRSKKEMVPYYLLQNSAKCNE